MVLVFDLDDTLYDEISYVHSGFKAVSLYLSGVLQVEQKLLYGALCEIESLEGRGRIFDRLLSQYNAYSSKTVKKCISVYRLHKPTISLRADALVCFEQFQNLPRYIVTDGNKLVQASKVKALGLEEKVKFIYITYRYGVKNGKPSPYCFYKICQRENTTPGNVLYVGDNPKKDFVGIKPLGFPTVRIRRGMFKDLTLDARYEADFEIESLTELGKVIELINHKQKA